MKKKYIGIILGIIFVVIVGFIFFNQKEKTEDTIITDLNEIIEQYPDLNTSNDDSFALRVDDTQMLCITYAPNYSLLGVSKNKYTTRPSEPTEVFEQETDLHLPICDFNNALIYNSKTITYYNVTFESKDSPTIPIFIEAQELK